MDISRPDLLKKKKKRSIVTWSVVTTVLVVIFVVVINLDFRANTVNRDQIWTAEVKKGDMTRTVEGRGSLVVDNAQWVSSRSSGSVSTVHVLPGKWMKKGDIIVTLSNPELEELSRRSKLELDMAQAELTSSRSRLQGDLLALKSSLKELEERAKMARIDADIAIELNRDGLSSDLEKKQAMIRTEQLDARLELEEERLAFREDSIEPELAVAKTQVALAESQHELLISQVEALVIRANTSGILQKLTLEAGMLVNAGDQIAQVADPRRLKAVLRVAEVQARSLAAGQVALVNTRTSGRLGGTVSRVDPNVEVGTVAVDIIFNELLPEGCRADQTVDGVITLDHLSSIVYVDRPPMVLDNESVQIFKLSSDESSAQRVLTKFGKASVSMIEVISGLTPGDKIIVSDTSRWDEFDQIEIK
ncbi:efflux RND transporter periplasmic adaptor subunit [Puniceicoccaceae bacterium K14]|nr:efflux RND transporter periplasmic adaptor subunit [Puniceicoccaceae bacterium K14]